MIHIICQIFDITCKMAKVHFVDQWAFEFRAAVLHKYRPFSNFVFFVVCGETLLPKGAYRPWDHVSIVVKRYSPVQTSSELLVAKAFSYLRLPYN